MAECSAMRCYIAGFFNPESWQRVARGRSGAETPSKERVVNPEGMPEFCDPFGGPFGVGGGLLDRRSGGVAALDPPATLWQAFSLAGQRSRAELSLQRTRRARDVHISAPRAARY
jgi:hypothetical protein